MNKSPNLLEAISESSRLKLLLVWASFLLLAVPTAIAKSLGVSEEFALGAMLFVLPFALALIGQVALRIRARRAAESDALRTRNVDTLISSLPPKIANEFIGDRQEYIHYLIEQGATHWQIKREVISTTFWAVMFTIRHLVRGSLSRWLKPKRADD